MSEDKLSDIAKDKLSDTSLEEKKLDMVEKNPVIITLWVGFIISVLSIIAILILNLAFKFEYDNLFFRIALGVFIVGVLILFFALILRRLRRKGINYFVTVVEN